MNKYNILDDKNLPSPIRFHLYYNGIEYLEDISNINDDQLYKLLTVHNINPRGIVLYEESDIKFIKKWQKFVEEKCKYDENNDIFKEKREYIYNMPITESKLPEETLTLFKINIYDYIKDKSNILDFRILIWPLLNELIIKPWDFVNCGADLEKEDSWVVNNYTNVGEPFIFNYDLDWALTYYECNKREDNKHIWNEFTEKERSILLNIKKDKKNHIKNFKDFKNYFLNLWTEQVFQM